MNRQGMDEIDKKLAYCYRNDFSKKKMCEITGLNVNKVDYRLRKLKDKGLKKWWEE